MFRKRWRTKRVLKTVNTAQRAYTYSHCFSSCNSVVQCSAAACLTLWKCNPRVACMQRLSHRSDPFRNRTSNHAKSKSVRGMNLCAILGRPRLTAVTWPSWRRRGCPHGPIPTSLFPMIAVCSINDVPTNFRHGNPEGCPGCHGYIHEYDPTCSLRLPDTTQQAGVQPACFMPRAINSWTVAMHPQRIRKCWWTEIGLRRGIWRPNGTGREFRKGVPTDALTITPVAYEERAIDGLSDASSVTELN
jgi:hypothetical protein